MNNISPAFVKSVADVLNDKCYCMTLDHEQLVANLQDRTAPSDLWQNLADSHPHLFASTPTFIAAASLCDMLNIVTAIEEVASLPAYRAMVLRDATPLAQVDHGPRGLFMGYDFHITAEGPKLIEINTNAGGAFLNAALKEAQKACCKEILYSLAQEEVKHFNRKILDMFAAEWKLQKPHSELRSIAIVDSAPLQQYLYPEFLLAKSVLEKSGYSVHICDPTDLVWDGECLKLGPTPIDFVYNRLVDFALEDPAHRALRDAYAAGSIVLSPNPHLHAVFANKRNLTVLSDRLALQKLGVTANNIAILSAIPQTTEVTVEVAEKLWAARSNLFFKPSNGHGGKAVYRGDKLTRRVWAEILAGNYVAQELVLPSQRGVRATGSETPFKMDVRIYTYAGKMLIAASRLYRGQTTNFRTEGGGFSPLFIV